jgi:hypothetical protein
VAPIAFLLIGLVVASALLFAVAGIFVSSISKTRAVPPAGDSLDSIGRRGLPALGLLSEYIWKTGVADYSMFAPSPVTIWLAACAATTSKVSPCFWHSLLAQYPLWLPLRSQPSCHAAGPATRAAGRHRERWQSGMATSPSAKLRASLLTSIHSSNAAGMN